ncbi:hypothetical protein WAI453_005473 [Rhynchosporium graminicola]
MIKILSSLFGTRSATQAQAQPDPIQPNASLHARKLTRSHPHGAATTILTSAPELQPPERHNRNDVACIDPNLSNRPDRAWDPPIVCMYTSI